LKVGFFGETNPNGKIPMSSSLSRFHTIKFTPPSSDSHTWTNLQLQSPLNVNWEKITYGNSTYLASSSNNGTSQGKLMYSTNGTSWTDINTGLNTSDTIKGVAYCLNKFIYWLGTNTYTVSDDGINWGSSISAPATMENVKLHCINNIFIVTGKASGAGDIFHTTDLSSLNSVTITNNYSDVTVKGIAFGNNMYISLIKGSSPVDFELRYSTSLNSSNWTSVSTNMTSQNDINFRNDKFVVVGDSGKINYSTDGLNWFNASSGTTSTLNSIY